MTANLLIKLTLLGIAAKLLLAAAIAASHHHGATADNQAVESRASRARMKQWRNRRLLP